MKKRSGFTLIELLITVAIVGLLASIALPLAEVAATRSKEQDLRLALREIRTAIDAYKKAADEGVIERPADATGFPPSLAALTEGVADKRKPDAPKVYFLRKVPADPFVAEGWGLRSYASPHDAPQEGKDVYDVYSKAPGAGLNGVPYRQW
ncbi:MAG TPA: type II secretion system protein [Burkholderiales bacterium]|nr:type II secretion system protein [Burkholderiales bacterium]